MSEKTKATPQSVIGKTKKVLFWIFWADEGLLVLLKYLILFIIVFVFWLGTYDYPSDYEKYITAYNECQADGMVTEAQCQSFAESIGQFD